MSDQPIIDRPDDPATAEPIASGSPDVPAADDDALLPADDDALLRSAARTQAGHPLALGLATGATLVLATVLLVLQNTERTDLHWAVWDVTAPTWVLTAVAFGLGALAWPVLGAGVRRARRRAALRRSAVHHLRHR